MWDRGRKGLQQCDRETEKEEEEEE